MNNPKDIDHALLVPPHHTPDGFRNNYLMESERPSIWKWWWERFTKKLPKPPANNYQFPVVQPDKAWLAANRTETTATWIGHATVLVQMNGMNVLTDPVLSERASPFTFMGPQRKVPTTLNVSELPHIDIVMISHNHYDHLDRGTVRKLNAQPGGAPLFLVPLGIKAWMKDVGIDNVHELDWWNSVHVQGLDFTFVPVQHWSARGLRDRNKTLWGGWAAQAGGARPFSFFFAGDTGYSKDFEDIGERFGGFDLALIPIGAYQPRWFMKAHHVEPAESVRIHQDIRAKTSIAIHWGTFELTDEPLDEPPTLLTQELQKAGISLEDFVVLKHGETMRF
jgi:L-ascorbate metabolism protein UlaG (beta-lactamase superfamily)